MAKQKFEFNRETLQFEQRTLPIGRRVARRSVQIIISAGIGVGLMLAYSSVFETPRSHMLRKEEQDLKTQIAMLREQVQASAGRIGLIENRDNNLYRTIFESDSIPRSVRQGGVGGAYRYEEYDKLDNGAELRNLALSIDHLSWRAYIQSKSFDEVTTLANEKERLLRCIPAIQPVSVMQLSHISSLFGSRRDPFTHERRPHTGLDFVAAHGTPIHATGDGVVYEVRHSAVGYGNQVVIDHGFGYKTRYAHLSKTEVEPGDPVKRGQIIGAMGNSGRSTGTHLHYEVLVKNQHVNPMFYFTDMTEELYEGVLQNVDTAPLD